MRITPLLAIGWLLLVGGCAETAEPSAADTPDGGASAASTEPPIEEVASDDVDQPWWESLPRAGWAEFERIELPEDQDWFEVYRIDAHTYALLEPGQWQEVISWVIEGEERTLLFDTGLGIGDVATLARALTDRELIVLNSHTHFDHVGGNHAFERLLGTDHPFAVARTEGRTHAQCLEDLFAEGAVWRTLPEGFDKERCRTRPWTVAEFVRDGERIDLGGRTLEVLFTPGHSPDSLSLLDAENRTVFVGDTFYPAPLYSHLEGSSFTSYRASAARLAGIADGVDLVAPGHNEPVRGGAILREMHDAFEAVAAGRPPDFESTDEHVHYFGTFSIITAAEPAASEPTASTSDAS